MKRVEWKCSEPRKRKHIASRRENWACFPYITNLAILISVNSWPVEQITKLSAVSTLCRHSNAFLLFRFRLSHLHYLCLVYLTVTNHTSHVHPSLCCFCMILNVLVEAMVEIGAADVLIDWF